MAGQKKEPDPLSRLFDQQKGRTPLPPVQDAPADPTNLDSVRPKTETAPLAASKPAPAPTLVPESEPAVDRQALARQLAAQARATAQIKAAQAQKASPPPAEPLAHTSRPEVSDAERQELARKLAAEAAARAPRPQATPSDAERQELARKLAAEARAKAIPPKFEKPTPTIEPGSRTPSSRLSAAPPPPKTRSAAEVLASLHAEPVQEPPKLEPPKAELSPLQHPAVVGVLQRLGMEGLEITACVVVDNRALQLALWKGHRARLLASNDLALGVAAGTVLHLLERAPAGSLLAAKAELGERSWLIWIDIQVGPVVAFPNASLWFNW
jgi:hypothetical protein